MKKQELVKEIVKLEWNMFQQVQNKDGRAACQDDHSTFQVMRYAQALAWSEAVLKSYLSDLKQAKAEGRNLVAEKYARMMRFTFPSEYKEYSSQLPPVAEQARTYITAIGEQFSVWHSAFGQTYPKLREKGRPHIPNSETISAEAYLLCELETYSLRTLALLEDYVMAAALENKNLVTMILHETVTAYGFDSLPHAERAL